MHRVDWHLEDLLLPTVLLVANNEIGSGGGGGGRAKPTT